MLLFNSTIIHSQQEKYSDVYKREYRAECTSREALSVPQPNKNSSSDLLLDSVFEDMNAPIGSPCSPACQYTSADKTVPARACYDLEMQAKQKTHEKTVRYLSEQLILPFFFPRFRE